MTRQAIPPTRRPSLGGRGAGLALAAILVATVAACGSGSSPSGDSTGAAGGSGAGSTATGASGAAGLTGTVTVLAAASLTESFDAIKADFEAAHPGVTVETSYGSSATLVQQVDNGAPASVLALAGSAAAEPLDKSLVKDTTSFARNILEIAVPPSNPAAVASINDLAKPTVKVVLCADTVPCGKAAQATFRKARVVPNVVSKEVDVKATLAKVRLGEADAAVVYHSDVVAAKDAVKGVAIEGQYNTSLTYPIITLTDDAATRAFVAYVLSDAGRHTLASFGFAAP
ncbi:molybdenum ABC transporter substrate-binding protein [Intrasporangium oryzae NRRL B-24470]|uniref:Molybdenum ABC transporter substrate-binding protein n=1 Tax=Intrasporangium oryzae NRRL B-24470 TaxID=1386089 RepID=W9G9D1_9MICO|nr:molybdate ABC transporter substrate-binding protein [Intrasporangium oryzae]EWT02650.1 molybdenum ABC transporter substrate-binding protein [Intrasporangium oryzae NRRL B-24470]